MKSDEFQKSLSKEFEFFSQSVKKPNIILVGGTGVGKSSLINECFGSELAKIGIGKPVTQAIESFSCESTPVVLFDTKGYEVGSEREKEFVADVISYAAKSLSTSEPIHLAWHCIQASGGRITQFDIEAVRKISSYGIPVAVVITKAEMFSDDESKDFIQIIRSQLPKIPVFETSTRFKQREWQLNELCEWSLECLPESLRVAFAASQKQSLKIKRAEAYKAIKQHIASSVTVSFTPIPVSDAPLLLANQAAMVARILFIYNLQHISSALNSAMLTPIVGRIISSSGVWAAGTLLKIIPGVGTILGGVINASVAGSITYAIGVATVELCELFIEKNLEGVTEPLTEFVKTAEPFFESQFKKHYESKPGV